MYVNRSVNLLATYLCADDTATVSTEVKSSELNGYFNQSYHYKLCSAFTDGED